MFTNCNEFIIRLGMIFVNVNSYIIFRANLLLCVRGPGTTDWSSGVWVEPSPVQLRTDGRCSLKQGVHYTQEM